MWRLIPILPLALTAPAADAPPEWSGDPRVSISAAVATSIPPDSARLHERARRLQDRFESLRRRALPRTSGGNRWQECDEVVGRFCLHFGGESEWEPVPDSPEILQARGDLLDSLTAIASEIPGDGWVVAQLVQYLGEEGRWSEALEWVDDCGAWEGAEADAPVSAFARARPGWWCHALRGFVLHRSDRYPEALTAFEAALERMHPDRRERWLNPDPLLDREVDDVWDDAEVGERTALRERLWALSDPLHLLEGNDRLTEHYARHTVSWIREDAENPYGMSWGWDLEELAVRYGSEMGWNRTRTSAGSLRPANVIGHHHPESRHFLPPAAALDDPTAYEEAGWGAEPDSEGGAGAEEPTTAYAPPYAPDLRFEPFQLARFRRGEEMIVVAGYRLPPDTAAWGDPEIEEPGVEESGAEDSDVEEADADVRAGFFLFGPEEGEEEREARGERVVEAGGAPASSRAVGGGESRVALRRGPAAGAFRIRAPMGRYLASVEVWDSASARAGRLRRGVGMSSLPPDVAAVSDLLILGPSTPGGPEAGDSDAGAPVASPGSSVTAPQPKGAGGLPQDLESAIPMVRPLAEMCPGEAVIVGWEITGIGFRREAIELALRLERTDRAFFSRVGDFLGLTSSPEPVTLEWIEEGPGEPEPFFRSVQLALPPEMEEGTYLLTLRARLPAREPLERERRVEVRSTEGCRVASLR